MLCAFAFVVRKASLFVLKALNIGERTGVRLEGKDLSVQALGSVAEEVLLDLNEA